MIFIPLIQPSSPSVTAHWFIFQNGRLLINTESANVPQLIDPLELELITQRRIFFGTLNGDHSFAAEVEEGLPAPHGFVWESLRSLLMRYEAPLVSAISRAVQLISWDNNHQFCGRCGTTTRRVEHEHSRECNACKLVFYPRISPAMMALVKRDNELLLARAMNFPEGIFSVLAGFVEPGESIEETVIREVHEEVGIEVSQLRYYGSQSWPFPHSLMIAFVCDYVSGNISPQVNEIAEAHWFHVNDLPKIPTTMSIAGRLIRSVAEELRTKQ